MEKEVANLNQEVQLIERLVDVRRVVKVVKGGRIFSFSAIVVVGDGNGSVAYGQGKSREVPNAIQKAMEKARNNMRKVALKNDTLQYPINVHEGAVKLVIKPASQGTGVIAGGPMRLVFEAVGIQNILAKCIGTRNKVNVVKATVNALYQVKSPKDIAAKRGIEVSDLYDIQESEGQDLEVNQNSQEENVEATQTESSAEQSDENQA